MVSAFNVREAWLEVGLQAAVVDSRLDNVCVLVLDATVPVMTTCANWGWLSARLTVHANWTNTLERVCDAQVETGFDKDLTIEKSSLPEGHRYSS